MPKGMKSVDLSDTAATTIFSNNVLHSDIKPRLLFCLKKEPGADGLTRSWSTIKANFRILQDILDSTGGHPTKQAKMLTQFIKWLEDHGVQWKWSDADKSIQHLRCQLRTIAAHSMPPGQAPKGHEPLQILIDKCVAARQRTSDDVEVLVVPPKPVKRVDLITDAEEMAPNPKRCKVERAPNPKRCKVEKEDFEYINNFFEKPGGTPPG